MTFRLAFFRAANAAFRLFGTGGFAEITSRFFSAVARFANSVMLAVSVRSPRSEVVFLSLVNVLFVMRANFFVIVFIHFNPYAEIVSEGFAVLFAANFADRLFGTSRFAASAFFGFTLMLAVSLTYLGMRSVAVRHPLVVAPGDKKSLSTNTRNDFAVSNTYSACKNIHNRLAVAKLTIPKFGYYEITVTSAQDVPNWGVFESLSCTADDFYQNSCLSTGEQKSRTMTRLLSPGDFYVFVGGINAKTAPPPFDATIELKQLDAPKAVACNYKGKVTPVDATKGSYTDKNKTSTGVTQAKGDNGGKCSNASTGKEIAYAFQLTQTQTVVAKIQITRENGEPCGANIEDKCPTPSLHIQKCADESALSARNNTVECAVLAESTNSLALEKQIPPGEYLLFVDSDSTSNSYAYDLTLTFK